MLRWGSTSYWTNTSVLGYWVFRSIHINVKYYLKTEKKELIIKQVFIYLNYLKSWVESKCCIFYEILLILLDDYYVKFIFLSFVLKNFYRKLIKLEIILDTFSLFLCGFSSIYESYIDWWIPENTIRNLSLSFNTKSNRYKSGIFSDIPILLSSKKVEVLLKVSFIFT